MSEMMGFGTPPERMKMCSVLMDLDEATEEWVKNGSEGFPNGWQFRADWLLRRGVRLPEEGDDG